MFTFLPAPYTSSGFFCHAEMTRWKRAEVEIETWNVFSCVFMAPLPEIPPLSIIYRLVSLGVWADSFIRWERGCFDLKIHTIIASGVEKVKESPNVLIRKKSLPIFPFFFFLSSLAERQENIEWGGIEDVLIVIPPSVIFSGIRDCVHRWFGK